MLNKDDTRQTRYTYYVFWKLFRYNPNNRDVIPRKESARHASNFVSYLTYVYVHYHVHAMLCDLLLQNSANVYLALFTQAIANAIASRRTRHVRTRTQPERDP